VGRPSLPKFGMEEPAESPEGSKEAEEEAANVVVEGDWA